MAELKAALSTKQKRSVKTMKKSEETCNASPKNKPAKRQLLLGKLKETEASGSVKKAAKARKSNNAADTDADCLYTVTKNGPLAKMESFGFVALLV